MAYGNTLHHAVPRPPASALPRNEATRREGVQDARGLVFAEAAPEPDLRTDHQDAPAHLVHELALVEGRPPSILISRMGSPLRLNDYASRRLSLHYALDKTGKLRHCDVGIPDAVHG